MTNDRTALAKYFRENADRLDDGFHTSITAKHLREAAAELERPVARDDVIEDPFCEAGKCSIEQLHTSNHGDTGI